MGTNKFSRIIYKFTLIRRFVASCKFVCTIRVNWYPNKKSPERESRCLRLFVSILVLRKSASPLKLFLGIKSINQKTFYLS
jgi:hypothetical protein